MTWYKVVQPNLASFADDTFKYRIGAARLAPKTKRRVLCEPGLLHASPSAPEAARYGRWPYRLLEVDPEGAEPVARQDDKAWFLRLKVVAELPVSECFGPNGEAVLRLVQRAEQLTEDEARQLAAARVAAGAAARDAARAAAWYAARDAAGVAARDAARDAARAAAWYAARDAAGVAARDAARDAARVAARYAARVAARVAARDAAGDVAWEAAGAVVAADLIGQHGLTQAHFDLLTEPWREVIGATWEES